MGFWVTRHGTGTTVLSFFRADNSLIDSVVHAPSGSASFIGLVASEPAAYATISMPSGDGWIALDDLQVSTVPAPGAGALLGLGGVLTVRRRRQ
jgi:MYXO-CTERM domain-containing protein